MSREGNISVENIDTESIKRSLITIGGEQIEYTLSPSENQESSNNSVSLTLKDPDNMEEFKKALQQECKQKYWWLSLDENETPIGRHELTIADGVNIEVYNFNPDIAVSQIKRIGESLHTFYTALRDKDSWNIKSIQIKKQDQINTKSNQTYKGKEFPYQQRFELFPSTFDEGNYRGNSSLPWLEGAVLHEATHLVLEPELSKLWKQNSEELGWVSSEDVRIQLPGGAIVGRVNIKPDRCPTEYASFQEDDDRADSVVFFLAGDKLDDDRAFLVSKVLKIPDENNASKVTVREYDTNLPKVPLLNVRVKKRGNIFKIGQIRKSGKPKPILKLEEYLSQIDSKA